ncbi:unnamed protein product [Lepeophtheirus salmonis]|uniref:(salmon louse) hypothetical protein n=1 Tax=Lepeophtheirus salmonis TaxID=72036 RepID=A0A0K2T9Q8_LEPSM|nr:unnamed protein product [Lepeophtheirus salmonis]CAG9477430.1 unnamed protein product [Lepeophtheirus salmonis]
MIMKLFIFWILVVCTIYLVYCDIDINSEGSLIDVTKSGDLLNLNSATHKLLKRSPKPFFFKKKKKRKHKGHRGHGGYGHHHGGYGHHHGGYGHHHGGYGHHQGHGGYH